MPQPISHAAIDEIAGYIRKRTEHRPRVMIVTGSGLAGLGDEVAGADVLPYSEIPGFPRSTVEGHPGELVFGQLQGQPVVVQRGRSHFYEGYSLPQVTLPLRVLRALGVEMLIVTNAAGGINLAWKGGDLMLITDHIGLPAMAGNNPLFGPNDTDLGPRFPIMAGAYDAALRRKAQQVAASLGFTLREGVYCWVAGPSFETPAEIRFLRMIGGDAVGMSTVPEVIVARHAGMRVLGISLISNIAEDTQPTGEVPAEVHDEVLAAGRQAVQRLAALIKGVLNGV
ncbi:MAG: purine-nucleoside phosphorylase [Anaerolineae bacterium]